MFQLHKADFGRLRQEPPKHPELREGWRRQGYKRYKYSFGNWVLQINFLKEDMVHQKFKCLLCATHENQKHHYHSWHQKVVLSQCVQVSRTDIALRSRNLVIICIEKTYTTFKDLQIVMLFAMSMQMQLDYLSLACFRCPWKTQLPHCKLLPLLLILFTFHCKILKKSSHWPRTQLSSFPFGSTTK